MDGPGHSGLLWEEEPCSGSRVFSGGRAGCGRVVEDLKSRGLELRDEGPVVGEGDVQIKGFGFKGPEGYTLEIFAWLRK